MANSTIQIPPDSTGKRLDTEQVSVAGVDVQRQRIQIAGSGATNLAAVIAAAPAVDDFGVVVRVAGDITAISSPAPSSPWLYASAVSDDSPATIVAAPGAGFAFEVLAMKASPSPDNSTVFFGGVIPVAAGQITHGTDNLWFQFLAGMICVTPENTALTCNNSGSVLFTRGAVLYRVVAV